VVAFAQFLVIFLKLVGQFLQILFNFAICSGLLLAPSVSMVVAWGEEVIIKPAQHWQLLPESAA
jgi:hypothetical protein